MKKIVFNSETNEMEEVTLTAEEIEQNEMDKSIVIPPQPPSEIEKLRLETAQANAEMFEMLLIMTGGSI